MNCATVENGQEVLISGVDFGRLSGLADSPRYRAQWRLLALLKKGLGRGVVVAPARVPADLVTMRSKVRVKETPGGGAETYTLVYPEEADIELKKISVLAPLGAALLGSRVGEVVDVQAPGGVRRLRIERVLYQPESAGHWGL